MKLLAALATPGLLILCYPPFDMGWLAWVAFLPLLAILEQLSFEKAILWGYLAGALFFAGSLSWFVVLAVPGFLVLAAVLPTMVVLWVVLMHGALQRGGWAFFVAAPSAWAVSEYLRGNLFSGFGWNLLGHTQWRWLEMIQISDLVGVYGVSFLIVLVNAALYLAWRKRKFIPLILAALCAAGALGYGASQVARFQRAISDPGEEAFRVAVVQGNIPQAEKWDRDYVAKIWNRYETLTDQAAKAKPDLIVWPETSVPGFLHDPGIAQRLKRLSQETGTLLLAGIPTEAPLAPYPMFNSAVLLGPSGEILEKHSKLHLVPFGEYIPAEPLLGWLNRIYPIGRFNPGERFTVFESPAGSAVTPFGVLICFEDLFPALSLRFVREGARFLFVITNDAWFEKTAASLQHLQASVFRAVEGRVWVVRAGNTGWSGFVDPTGRVLKAPHQIPRFKPGTAEALLHTPKLPSPYLRWGDWFVGLAFGVAALTFRRRGRYNRS